MLTSVFNDVTNSYKFYWFLAILDEIKDTDNDDIPIQNLYERMVSQVWYPLDFYKLSFGKQDSFINVIEVIKSKTQIDNGANAETPINQIKRNLNAKSIKELRTEIQILVRWVPYRFIRPFFANELAGVKDQIVNNSLKNLAETSFATQDNKCPYYFLDDRIVLNKYWKKYFKENIFILRTFVYWHLIKFLQKNNPNVIGISEKIFKPLKRNLTLNTASWKLYLQKKPNTKCIYTYKEIPNNFSLDHLIPWSYVVNDLNWNIIPTFKEINSKKSDNLPFLKKYLEPFVDLQYDFFHTLVDEKRSVKIIEQYNLLFNLDTNEIQQFPKEHFIKKLKETIIPMEQIARNMKFGKDWQL